MSTIMKFHTLALCVLLGATPALGRMDVVRNKALWAEMEAGVHLQTPQARHITCTQMHARNATPPPERIRRVVCHSRTLT